MFDLDALAEAGFRKRLSEQEWRTLNSELNQTELAAGGEYHIDYVLGRDDVTVTIEQNVSTQEHGGMQIQTRHPAIAVVEGPNGRASCSVEYPELILELARQVG